MTRERIEDMREVVLPFVKKRLLETNYEGLGKSDAEEFTRDFNEILELAIKALEQEQQTFKWCTDCKEYDQKKHCCHRWSKAIRNTVEEMKQEYIEREVLDKIRAEIETKYGQCDICEYFEDYDYEENDISEYRPIGNIADILQIIDNYRAETESQESEDKNDRRDF